jgi:hypothetical protein
MNEPSEKVMKYNYEKNTDKLGEFRILKFRPGVSATREGLILSIEKDGTSEKMFYFLLRS